MDPRLLSYYDRELQFLREMGGEFAREFPKIAGRIGLDGFEVADPYVERLLEGFAFLAARVHLKLDDEFPRFTQNLLELVYPQYLCPTPSLAVVQMVPNLREGALSDGVTIPRGSALRSQVGKDQQTACEYRTGHDVTLWPIEIASAGYLTHIHELRGLPASGLGNAKAALRLGLRTTAGLRFDQLSLDRLPLFLRGDLKLTHRLYEQLLGHTVSVLARRPEDPAVWYAINDAQPLRAIGFESHEALLPQGARAFEGHRLLHEYFAFPQRFMFAELCGLSEVIRKTRASQLELFIMLDVSDRALDDAVDASYIAPFCTPAANLFPRRADRVHLSDATHEYHVIPDRTRPLDFEVHTVTDVVAYGTSKEAQRRFFPFYGRNEPAGAEDPAYYTVRREARRLSERQRTHGRRSSYLGSEVFIALVDGEEGPFHSDLKQLAPTILCTNRDLPLHMPIGQGRTDFTLESGAPVEAVTVVAGPSAPRPSHAQGEMAWRLISHLSLNYLSLTDARDGKGGATGLRELLELYADLGDIGARRRIEGVLSVDSQPVVRRLPHPGATAFGRGVQITLTCDESAFEGAGVFLLGAVLERFFGRAVPINSFTETALKSIQRGEVMRWPPRLGRTPAL